MYVCMYVCMSSALLNFHRTHKGEKPTLFKRIGLFVWIGQPFLLHQPCMPSRTLGTVKRLRVARWRHAKLLFQYWVDTSSSLLYCCVFFSHLLNKVQAQLYINSSGDEIPERDVTYHLMWLLIYHWMNYK